MTVEEQFNIEISDKEMEKIVGICSKLKSDELLKIINSDNSKAATFSFEAW